MGRRETIRQTAARRRDERAVSVEDAPGPGVAPVRRKDRKRWCGGHVGRDHTTKCVSYAEVKRVRALSLGGRSVHDRWKILVCTTCGKELAHHYPFGASRREPPSWVTP